MSLSIDQSLVVGGAASVERKKKEAVLSYVESCAEYE